MDRRQHAGAHQESADEAEREAGNREQQRPGAERAGALGSERTGAFRSWSLLLAIAGFSLSLIGTFLVRSGVLSSVHAFASDPTRGFFIMILIEIGRAS